MIIERLIKSFGEAIKPQTKLSITDWASKHVRLARSLKSEMADLNITPWLKDTLESIIGNDYSEICLTAPTGGGKTTALEILITYLVAEKPGPLLYGSQTDNDAKDWMVTGLRPALENCELIKPLLPKNRNHITNKFIKFNHMPLWVGGCGLSNLQSKSCKYVILDEAWMLKRSIMQEARRRTHDNYGNKVVLTSQAGVANDDFDKACRDCVQKEWTYKCPNCGNIHPYLFEDLKWVSDKNETGDVIWESIDCWYQCPTCEHKFLDNVKDKRAMAESGSYIDIQSKNPKSRHIHYHFNCLTVWFAEGGWKKVIINFLQAKNDARKGMMDNLRQFNQKYLAIPWNEVLHLEKSELKIGEYTKKDAETINYGDTILTFDVQKQDIWYIVRTWSKNGDSKLLECNKVVNFPALIAVADRYKLQPNHVFGDSAYRPQEVKELLARTKWIGLNGNKAASFAVKNPYTGKIYRRLWDTWKPYKTSMGIAKVVLYSSSGIKDILFILKAGHGTEWGVPIDIGEDYQRQLKSEIKVMGNNNVLTYKQTKGDNHWLDCEAEQIVAAQMLGCYPNISYENNEDEN